MVVITPIEGWAGICFTARRYMAMANDAAAIDCRIMPLNLLCCIRQSEILSVFVGYIVGPLEFDAD